MYLISELTIRDDEEMEGMGPVHLDSLNYSLMG